MKKSSLLHKSKDMLSKGFNPAKCKTSLRLASSRIKLMKNKKDVQVKQMKRELAQLLESSQDQTARIRVEHVIREEKMMAAYELIEIYCELIVARLPIIETQKNCPIDLKEAIASVIFASPRCGDITELLDVRKHFTGKYGKEFTNRAIELRPDCGVSRMLIEKLSANAPDGQTKIKTLTAIAEEHGVKWDPKSFGESEALPPNDLLNGPATFEKDHMIHVEESRYRTPDGQVPSPARMHDQPKSSLGSENFASENNGGRNYAPATPQHGMSPSGARSGTAENYQSFHQEGSGYSHSQQNWNMNFKDAAAAAQAAAESAEHASMAARAAAELSSIGRPVKQFPPESQDLRGNSLRGEGTRKQSVSRVSYVPRNSANSSFTDQHPVVGNEYNERNYPAEPKTSNSFAHTGEGSRFPTSKVSGDHLPRDSANSSFAAQQTGALDEQRETIGRDSMQKIGKNTYSESVDVEKRSPQTSSLTSKLLVGGPPVSGFHEADRHSLRSSLKTADEVGPGTNLKEETYEDEPEHVNPQVGFNHYDNDYFEEKNITERSSNSHFSHPSSTGIDHNYSDSGPVKYESDSGDHHPVGVYDDLFQETAQSSSHDGGVVMFDDYGSDSEDIGFPVSSHLDEQSKSFNSLTGRTSPAHFSTNTGAGSLGFQDNQLHKESESLFSVKRNSSTEFSKISEAPLDSSTPDKHGPVIFDDSDGPSSDNEIDMDQYQDHNTKDSTDFLSKPNETVSSASSSFHASHWKNSQGRETVVEPQDDFGLSKAPADHSSPGLGKTLREPSDASKFSSRGSVGEMDEVESSTSAFVDVKASLSTSRTQMDDVDSTFGTGLNFGKLTGGLRHKGHGRLAYKSPQSDDFSASSGEVAEVIPARESPVDARKSNNSENARSSRLPRSHLDYDDETLKEEYEKKPTSRGQDSFLAQRNWETKANVRGPVKYFDSGSSDSEDDSAKQVSASKSPFASGASRRTKANFSDPDSNVTKVRPTSSVNSKSGEERIRTNRFSGTDAPPQVSESRIQQPDQFGDLEQPSSAREGYKPNPDSNISSYKEKQTASSGEGRIQTARFSETETHKPSVSHIRHSGPSGDSEQPSSARHRYKSNRESNISSYEENKRSSAAAKAPLSDQKPEPSESTEKPSSGGAISREDSSKKASHVHPKLPDYDTIAARLQALRTNRQ